jgi:uncharacterized membrane protein YtjA (UPF0391 family)
LILRGILRCLCVAEFGRRWHGRCTYPGKRVRWFGPEGKTNDAQKETAKMLWTILVILLVLWLLGIVSGYTVGGFIHILLVVALVIFLINLLTGRRTV